MRPSNFMPLISVESGCDACGSAQAATFKFSYAYQPIVDVVQRCVWGHEALVRGPQGESAFSVLSQVTDENRYRFDRACRVKAIKGAAQLGIEERLSINFLPNAIYKPEVCIRTTLAAARASSFPIERIVFEATEGEAISDGPRLAEILREYKRTGFITAIDDFGAETCTIGRNSRGASIAAQTAVAGMESISHEPLDATGRASAPPQAGHAAATAQDHRAGVPSRVAARLGTTRSTAHAPELRKRQAIRERWRRQRLPPTLGRCYARCRAGFSSRRASQLSAAAVGSRLRSFSSR